MEKTYNPRAIEQTWYQQWENNGYFKAQGSGDPYCIVIPPPNVTGSLHMGHAFQDTIMDILTRYHRMKGERTLWQPGTDHAGIATQMVVERQLSTEKKSRLDLGRDEFIKRIWGWKQKSGGHITQQLRRMGASPDWTRERFTMDDGLSTAVQVVFIQLFDEGLIYRGKRLVNWDPVLRTAVSDLEVMAEEEDGYIWHIRYPVIETDNFITIATTRPETMLGDTAVAIHPHDPRYTHLLGKYVELPLSGRRIPIIADDYVDPEFGSGCVKITPAHDFNDYEVGQRHDLELINIFTHDARINDQAPQKYQGMDRYVARQAILKDLEALDLLESVSHHKLMVPRGDRTQSVIEPYLTDQWFVRTRPLAEPAIAAVKNGRIKFIPENWTKTYFNWMEDIQDWCISRQIWWGHRIPAWYDKSGNIYVAESAEAARRKYKLTDNIMLDQDQDVLDTWFSSALWPFSTLGWPVHKDPALQTFYPTSVLVTGFDIIFFWVARMIMFGLKFMQDVPFRQVYIHGLVRDAAGNKMSKSKGNVLDPIDLIDGITLDSLLEKRTTGLMQPEMKASIVKSTKQHFPNGIPAFGTDALRFTFTALATTGRDIRFDLGRIAGYRNFCNKLWNATRYVLQNTQTDYHAGTPSLADRWITARLQQVINNVIQHIELYRFDLVSRDLYEFVWNDYCDWYIELSKPVLYSDQYGEASKSHARYTLISVLETSLRLLHPIMPYITEELWQRVAPLSSTRHPASIMLSTYPQADNALIDDKAIETLEWVKQFIIGIRQIRAENDVAPGKTLRVICQHGSDSDYNKLIENRDLLISLAKLKSLDWLAEADQAPESATSLIENMRLLVPLEGLIDKNTELQRLHKKTQKLEQEIQRLENKLKNAQFIANAPEAIVNKENDKLLEARSSLTSLQTQVTRIENM